MALHTNSAPNRRQPNRRGLAALVFICSQTAGLSDGRSGRTDLASTLTRQRNRRCGMSRLRNLQSTAGGSLGLVSPCLRPTSTTRKLAFAQQFPNDLHRRKVDLRICLPRRNREQSGINAPDVPMAAQSRHNLAVDLRAGSRRYVPDFRSGQSAGLWAGLGVNKKTAAIAVQALALCQPATAHLGVAARRPDGGHAANVISTAGAWAASLKRTPASR